MSKLPVFRTYYDGLQASVSDATALRCAQWGEDAYDGMTQQQFKDECDINNIMAKYEATGLVRVRETYMRGEYADLSNAPDYQTALNIVIRAQDSFDALPASLRKRFSNDPEEFLAFVHDPKNEPEMRTLGLLKPKEPETAPIAVRVISPEKPPAEQSSAEPKA